MSWKDEKSIRNKEKKKIKENREKKLKAIKEKLLKNKIEGLNCTNIFGWKLDENDNLIKIKNKAIE